MNYIDNETPKYKKKSKAKGQPRANHKHIYETVLLISNYHSADFKTGKPEVIEMVYPTKVCTICGRVGETDRDDSYYVKDDKTTRWLYCHCDSLSEKALKLPKWYRHDYFDKFAFRKEEEEKK